MSDIESLRDQQQGEIEHLHQAVVDLRDRVERLEGSHDPANYPVEKEGVSPFEGFEKAADRNIVDKTVERIKQLFPEVQLYVNERKYSTNIMSMGKHDIKIDIVIPKEEISG